MQSIRFYELYRIIFVFLYVLVLYVEGFSQHQNVQVGGSVSKHNPNETCIAINPENTLEMVVGANKDNFYYSNDGGLTWTHGTLTSSHGVFCDPCVAVDSQGRFYYFHLPLPTFAEGHMKTDRIVCQELLNKETFDWSDGSSIGMDSERMNDKEWAGIDWRNDHLYCAWTAFDQYGSSDPQHRTNILFSKSTDGGSSWSNCLRINEESGDCLDEDNTVEGTVFAFGPNEEIYVSWVGPSGLIFDRSTDQGLTWLDHDIIVADIPGGWDFSIPGVMRCSGFPSLACDLSSGPYHGTLYASWSDRRNGEDDTDVWLCRSTDGGDTWTTPLRVNDDAPGRHQFFNWMTVDPVTGIIYVVFYDRRHYTDNQTDVFIAVSRDGGLSFVNNRISETPFTPSDKIFLGDYIHIAAHNNIIRPIWTRIDGEINSIWTALIDPGMLTSIEDPGVISTSGELELLPAHPNPFNSQVVVRYYLPEREEIKLQIIDITGKERAVIFEGSQSDGFHSCTWSPSGISSGLYLIRLSGNRISKTSKVVLVK